MVFSYAVVFLIEQIIEVWQLFGGLLLDDHPNLTGTTIEVYYVWLLVDEDAKDGKTFLNLNEQFLAVERLGGWIYSEIILSAFARNIFFEFDCFLFS